MGNFSEHVLEVVDELERVLHGHSPEVQGVALADVLATYLAGFFVANGDARANAKLRMNILQMHVGFVRQIIPLNEKKVLERGEMTEVLMDPKQ